MVFYSSQTSTSSANTNKRKSVTASATASATSELSQEDADAIAKQISDAVSQDSANTQAALINTSYLNENVPNLSFYLTVDDFVKSLVEVSTTLMPDTTTTDSLYIYGRSTVYKVSNDESSGICSAAFMCSKNDTNIYTDITNYLSFDNGFIVSWLTPSTLLNLELDTIVNGMVTECIVTSTTKIGENPFYGLIFNLTVSSDNGKIYFNFTSYNN